MSDILDLSSGGYGFRPWASMPYGHPSFTAISADEGVFAPPGGSALTTFLTRTGRLSETNTRTDFAPPAFLSTQVGISATRTPPFTKFTGRTQIRTGDGIVYGRDLLPPNASRYMRAISAGMRMPEEIWQKAGEVGTAKVYRPSDVIMFLIYEYGLEQVIDWVTDPLRVLSTGRDWQRIRGTNDAIMMALDWIDFTPELIEELPRDTWWDLFQMAFREPMRDRNKLASIFALTRLSKPAHTDLIRVYNDECDDRAFEINGYGAVNGEGLINDWSGIWLRPDWPKVSFGHHFDLRTPPLTQFSAIKSNIQVSSGTLVINPGFAVNADLINGPLGIDMLFCLGNGDLRENTGRVNFPISFVAHEGRIIETESDLHIVSQFLSWKADDSVFATRSLLEHFAQVGKADSAETATFKNFGTDGGYSWSGWETTGYGSGAFRSTGSTHGEYVANTDLGVAGTMRGSLTIPTGGVIQAASTIQFSGAVAEFPVAGLSGTAALNCSISHIAAAAITATVSLPSNNPNQMSDTMSGNATLLTLLSVAGSSSMLATGGFSPSALVSGGYPLGNWPTSPYPG